MRALAVSVVVFVLVACVGDDPDSVSSASTRGPLARSIQCNDARCATGEVCCLKLGTTFVDEAACATEEACTTGAALVCDSTADCPDGQICCVKTNGNSLRYGPSFCNTKCESPDRQLCAGPEECASGSCAPPQSMTTPTRLRQCD